MSTKTWMTVEDFARLRTSETEDYELVEGELIILSSGTIRHNQLRDLLGHLLWAYFKGRSIGDAIGEIDCQLSDDTVRRPDVAIFLGENFGHLDQSRIPVPFAPDIAVEVLSQLEKAIDVNRKVREYLGAGCQEVWLVDDANKVLFVHAKSGIRMLTGAESLETALLPGFTMTLAELLA